MIWNLISKAKDLFYSNKSSGLSATNVQDAIDELPKFDDLDTYYSLTDAIKKIKQSATVTVPANDLFTTSLTLPVPSGYTLIGLGGVQMGDKSLVPISFFCSSGNKVALSIRNIHASELTASVVVHGFCCKTHLK